MQQSFSDFELILVNDGSTDNSLEICLKYKNIDDRIVIFNKENQGSIATRKKGVEIATSEYIIFVDADDWIDRKAIEILYDAAIRDHIDITVCNIYKVLGNGNLIKRKNTSKYFNQDKMYEKQEIKNDLVIAYLHGHPFPSSLFAKLYKRNILLDSGKYLDRIHFLGDDLFYNIEIFLKANKVKIIDKPLYYYRLGGYTSKYMPHLFDDIVNGYQIQKEVINEYYYDTKQKRYNGISVMLLNTFKTSLFNIFNSSLSKNEIKQIINKYITNESILEATENEYSLEYFSPDYLNAIRNSDVDFLYRLGNEMYRKNKPKKLVKSFISKLAVI